MSFDNNIGQMTIALQSIIKANVQAFMEYQRSFASLVDANAEVIAAQIKKEHADMKKGLDEMVKSLQSELKGGEEK